MVRVKRRTDTALVVNPNSCGGLTGRNWDTLYAKMKGIFGSSIRVVFSKGPSDGTTATRNLLRKGFSRVVAIGGDGTINEVVNGFFEESAGVNGASLRQINPDAVMGLIPCGTRNVLAKSLELPEGIIPCCKNFVGGQPAKMDVIAVSATDPKDGSRLPPRVFLNAAEMGVGAEIIDRSKKVRSKVRSRLISTVAAIISTVPSYESNLCEFSIDRRKKLSTNMTMGVVANGKFLGGGFLAAPRADVSDGLLDFVVLKDSGSLKMLDELVNIKTGNYSNDDNILYAQARRVTIKSKERNVTVTIDGEPIGILPARFQVLPGALNVVV
jgi:diacylglycerol kinase (ATP)